MLKHWVLMINRVLGSIWIEVLALIGIKWQRSFFYLYFLDLIQSLLEFGAFYIVEDSLRATFVEGFIFLAPWWVCYYFFYFAIRDILEKQIKFRVVLPNGRCLPILMLIQILERIFSRSNCENEITLNWCYLLFKIGFVIRFLFRNRSLFNHLSECDSHLASLTGPHLAIWIKARKYLISESLRRKLALVFAASLGISWQSNRNFPLIVLFLWFLA